MGQLDRISFNPERPDFAPHGLTCAQWSANLRAPVQPATEAVRHEMHARLIRLAQVTPVAKRAPKSRDPMSTITDAGLSKVERMWPPPERIHAPSARYPNWRTDDPDPRGRGEPLRDFAARMLRCKNPAQRDSNATSTGASDAPPRLPNKS